MLKRKSEERKKHIKDLWEGIFKAVPIMPSGAGFILYGECGLQRKSTKNVERKFKVFTLDKETW